MQPAGLDEVTLLLHARQVLPAAEHATPARHMSHEQLMAHHGAAPEVAADLRRFAHAHGLQLSALDLPRRTAYIGGSAEAIKRAFPADGAVPAALQGSALAVLGRHGSPAARRSPVALPAPTPGGRQVRQLAAAYDFPLESMGAGQTIGLIELSGGFRPDDIRACCERNRVAMPRISVVEVRGGANRPASSPAIRAIDNYLNGKLHIAAAAAERSTALEEAQATVEVTMDLSILAALAPAAHLVVYFSTPDEQGLFHALHRAIYDQVHTPSVISISWGEAETALTPAYLAAVDALLLAAAHLGITICASSGDAGALNHSPDRLPAVNFPASSPHCLACGGTTPAFAEGAEGTLRLLHEAAWNSTHYHLKGATGGGVSRTFPLPAWQCAAAVPLGPTGLPGRGVPDVAGPADPRAGGEITVAGRSFTSSGTSSVAPFWAALVACCNQALGHRVGHLHTHLYHVGHGRLAGLHPVEQGHNDGYVAGPGWNPCTGYGTPSGVHLLRNLAARMRGIQSPGNNPSS